MLYGGVGKFFAPKLEINEIHETLSGFQQAEDAYEYRKTNFMYALRGSGFFWPFLGICEILFGAMLFHPRTRFFGAVLLLPITLNILLFHIFLDYRHPAEIFSTGGLFIANLILVLLSVEWKILRVNFRPSVASLP